MAAKNTKKKEDEIEVETETSEPIEPVEQTMPKAVNDPVKAAIDIASKRKPAESKDMLSDLLVAQAKEGMISGEINNNNEPSGTPALSWPWNSSPINDTERTWYGTKGQWLTPEMLNRLKTHPATGNYSSAADDVNDSGNASEMSPTELLKKYFDQAFTTEEYKGLSEQETKDITDKLREQASKTEEDVLGKYASMTGGIPSTAAVQQAAKAGTDVISQLQDVLDSREQEKYNRYRTEQSDAYSKLSQLMSLYGYNSSGKKESTTGTSETTTMPDSLSTDVGSPNVFSQIATVSGLDPKTLSGYSSSRIEKLGQTILGEDNPNEMASGEVFKSFGPEAVAYMIQLGYPNEAPFLLSAIIDYLYENAYIDGNEREEWLRETGLYKFYANEKARNNG